MQIVPSTFLALAVIAGMMLRGPVRGLWMFLVLAPFGAAAAINLPAAGGASILVLDLAVLALFGLLILQRGALDRLGGTMRLGLPGFWLLLLTAFCMFAAIMLPRVFAGETEVFSLARIANETGIVSIPLRPTTGNLTQLFRIMLGVLTFFAVATLFRDRPDPRPVFKAMVIVTSVHVGLGVLDVLTGMVGAGALLDPIRTANYAILSEHRMLGIKRMIGGFPEASSFGFFSLGLFGFWLQYWTVGPRSRVAGWMLILSAFVLLRSTSSSAYAAGVAFLLIFAALGILRGLRPKVGSRGVGLMFAGAVAGWLAAVGIFAAYNLFDPVTAFLDRALFDKLDSQSGIERGSWNTQAWKNFIETNLMGAGLGSVRASNWFLACLGSLGILGTGLFLAFLWQVLCAPERSDDEMRDATIRGLKMACLAMFTSAMLTHPTPDLGVPFFAFAGLAAGLARGGALERRRTLDDLNWRQSLVQSP